MTAVGLGQQGSQARGSGFEVRGSSHCQIFLRLIPNIFRYSKLVKHERVPPPPTEIFGTMRQKIFRRKILILAPPPLLSKLFRYPNLMKHKGFPPPPTEIFGTVRRKIFDRQS